MRDGALIFGDDDFAVHIQNFRLFEVHRDAALRGARVLQNFCEAHRRVDHPDKVGVFFYGLLVAFIELGDFGVRHAVAGADDGGGDAALYDLAAPIDLHEAGEGEPFHALVEGADAVGEGGRQHGQHAVGEVDARPAPEGLFVENAVPRHIVRHVRDVHAERKMPSFSETEMASSMSRVSSPSMVMMSSPRRSRRLLRSFSSKKRSSCFFASSRTSSGKFHRGDGRG